MSVAGYLETVRALGTLELGLEALTDFNAAAARASRTSVGFLPGSPSASALLDHMNSVKLQIGFLDRDVAENVAKLSDAFRTNWEQYKADFKKFYEDNEGWASRFFGWNEIDDQTTRYESTLKTFYDQFGQQVGKAASMPTPTPTPVPMLPAGTAGAAAAAFSAVTPFVWAGFGVAGLFGVVALIRAVKTP